MKTKRQLHLIVTGILLFLICVAQAFAQQTSKRQLKLSSEEQKVIKYLVADWSEDYSVTSVDIAMAAVKMKPSDDSRFRMGNYIKEHPELHEIE